MLRAAVDDGLLTNNPAEKLGRQLRLVTPKVTRQENIKAMTREQRQCFLAQAQQDCPRLYPLFATLAGTGMRLGEVVALQWSDVDYLEPRAKNRAGVLGSCNSMEGYRHPSQAMGELSICPVAS
jgi:integrase